MKPKKLDDGVLVSGQLRAADIDSAAQAGFKMIVNNRPDGEEPDQPASAELGERAEAQGIAYRHIPVSGGKYDDASIRAMGEALDATEGKALIFCRTGMRSTTLRSEEHTSELQSLMRISYAVLCLKKKTKTINQTNN